MNKYKHLFYILYIFFLPIWYFERLIPRQKNLWIFGAWYGQRYSDNSRALYEHCIKYHPEIKAVWITRNKAVCQKLKREQKPVCLSYSLSGILCCLRAKIAFISNSVLDFNPFFLNGIINVWLWHGMPIKKIGYSEEKNKNIPRLKLILSRMLNPYHQIKIDYTITASDFFLPFLAEAFRLPISRILKTGSPRCDVFFTNRQSSYIMNLRETYKDAKILMYMPTFRKALLTEEPFNPFIEGKYGFTAKAFYDWLSSNNIIFLYKPHFIDDKVHININNNRFIFLTDDKYDDLYEVLNSIDILMTDYSSVYFDFLAARKPIILAPFDYEEYIKHSRAHYYDYNTVINEEKYISWNGLLSKSFDNIKSEGVLWKQKIFYSYCTGKSSESIYNYFFKRCSFRTSDF
jgi:CDP-glycerol glycerophosphotransferase